MESKESARLKDIRDGLKNIELRLREQNQQLKNIAASLQAMHERIVAFKESHNMDISEELEKGDTNETE